MATARNTCKYNLIRETNNYSHQLATFPWSVNIISKKMHVFLLCYVQNMLLICNMFVDVFLWVLL